MSRKLIKNQPWDTIEVIKENKYRLSMIQGNDVIQIDDRGALQLI